MATQSVRREQSLLHIHRTLLRSGLSLVSAFAWVFVFEYVFAFSGNVAQAFLVALLVYALSQVTLMLVTPLSAAHLRGGVKRSMLFGACFAALSFAVLGATLTGYFSSPISWGFVFFGILLGAYRALYWIPFRLQSADLGGKQPVLYELLIALMPAFAGVTLASVYLSSFRLLFGASVLMLLSIVPIFSLGDFGERFEWRYTETFKKLFDARFQALSCRAALLGIENAALFIIWPLSVFLIIGRSYLIFGFVMSASLLVLLVGKDIYRQFMSSRFGGNSVALDVAFSISGWILRLAAGSPIAIVFADSYSYVSAPAGSPEFLSREHASDAGSYIDEYTALQEIGMAFGRIVMCAFTGVMLFTAPLSIALALSLIVAAFAAGAATALSHKIRIEAY